jgi:histidine decarboxylase
VAVFSSESHYSIVKAVHAMAVPTIAEIGNDKYPGQCPITADGHWPKSVPTNPPSEDYPIGNGAIDIDKLEKVVDFLAGKGHPILLVLNYGTTFKGAYDDVEEVGRRILPILRRHGLDSRTVCNDFAVHENGKTHHRTVCHWRTGYWIHVDAALGGAYMPFLEMAHNAGQFHSKGPAFDFRLPFVQSVVMSGHKWPGAPWPTGIYMTKRKLLIHPPDHPEYIGSPDTTYAGSRNGFSALIMWYFTATQSYAEQARKAVRCQEVAEYAEKRFRQLEHELGMNLYVQRSPLSVCVLFREPDPQIVFDYSLSTKTVPVPGKSGEFRKYGHFFTMNDVNETLVDSLVERLRQPGAFPARETVGPGEAYDHSF